MMRRLIGVLLILVGLAAVAYAAVTFLSATTMLEAAQAAEAAALCGSSESVVVRTERLSNSTSFGNVYFCVDAQGNEREITDQIGQKYIATVIQLVVVLVVGVVLAVVGLVLVLLKRSTGSPSPNPDMNVRFGGQSLDLNALIQQASEHGTVHTVNLGTGNLTESLRQLEETLRSGLISQEEYDRLRQQILDTMR